MPMIEITLGEGRSPEQLAALLRAVTLAASETIDAPPETVRVVLREVPLTHWAVGGVSIAERRAAQPPAV